MRMIRSNALNLGCTVNNTHRQCNAKVPLAVVVLLLFLLLLVVCLVVVVVVVVLSVAVALESWEST